MAGLAAKEKRFGSDRAPGIVGAVLVVVMAGAVGILRSISTTEPSATPSDSTTSSTLPGYPLDLASTRPVVPWIDHPSAGPRKSPFGEVLACSASQIRVVAVGSIAATGHVADFVEVSNRGDAPCSISGRPLVELRDRSGGLVTRSGTQAPFMCASCGHATPGPLLVPGGSAVRSLPDYPNGDERLDLPKFTMAQGPCPGGVFPPGGELVLAISGGRVRVESEGEGLPAPDYRCDLPATEYSPPGRPELLVSDFVGIPVADYLQNDKVHIEISAPPEVRAGSILRYRIRARVSGDVVLRFLGCPGYTETLSGTAPNRYSLNCERLYDPPPREVLSDQWFDMQLPVPKSAPLGPQTLIWQLDPPFRTASAQVPVVVKRTKH